MTDPTTRRRGVRQAGAAAVVTTLSAVVALVLGRIGTAFLQDPQLHTTTLWLAAAVGLFATLCARPARRPSVLAGLGVGVAAANLISGKGLLVSTGYGLANAVEAGAAAVLIGALTGLAPAGGIRPRGRGDAGGLVAALLGGVLAGACVVAATLWCAEVPDVLVLSRGYLCAHTVGLLIVAPLLLVLPRTAAAWRTTLRQRRLNVQWALGLIGIAAFTAVIFFSDIDDAFGSVMIVPLLAAAALLTPVRALSTLVAACVIAVLGTVHGHGPLSTIDDPVLRTTALQGLLAAYCLMTITVTLIADGRMRATARLRDAERLADLAFDHAPTGMLVSSLAPGHVGEILAVNTALCELLHRRPEQLVGRHVKDLAPAADAATADEHIAAMVSGAMTSYTRERALVRADGRVLPTSHAINVVRPEDGPPYAISQITDLRGRIEAEKAMADALEAQLVAVAKLRELNAARVDAAARLAHDLRSPLTCVRAYQELLLTGAAGDLTDEQEGMLEIAMRNADRVIGLVDELVSTASLELEKIDVLRLTRMPVGQVITAALDTVQPVCTRQQQVLVRPTSGLDVVVAADPVQLERALVNVLANAAKYTPEGGRITVTVSGTGDGIAIAVADTGIGIPAHQLGRVGEQFFRADTAQASRIKGTGLGLAVTRAVLAKHGGRLHVESAAGHGSTFTLWLPLATGRDAASGEIDAAAMALVR